MHRDVIIDPEFQRLLLPLQPEEYAQLERNILEEGCREPLLFWKATLIDGHNRYEICTKHGIEFEVAYLDFESRKDAHDWIINNQLGRRNVTPEQASYLRGKRYNAEKKQGKRTDLTSDHSDQKLDTDQKLAAEYHVGEATIRRDAKFAEAVDAIADNAGEEARRAILSGVTNLSKKDALEVSELEPEQQREVIEQGDKAAERLKAIKSEERRQERIATVVTEAAAPLSALGRFPVIYADPPWRYDFSKDSADEIENQYPTMPLEEICALPVSDAATADCVLLLWVTSPKLEEAFTVLKAWGFAYRTCAVWDKEWIGPGYYFRQRHELLLIGTRGAVPVPRPADRPDSIFAEKRTAHSKKPEIAYRLIERMYPELPKLELFSRQPREGWTAWGNEASRKAVA